VTTQASIGVTFYLGAHQAHWLALLDVPLFVSHRRLVGRRTLPRSLAPWVLDSGGFTELSLYGEWRMAEPEYVTAVRRYVDDVGRLEWVAPMDWMCEPHIREKTGLSTAEHQARTVTNFLRLRDELGYLVVPVLQGWDDGDHQRHAEMYAVAGVDLSAERLVGVGSICRRRDASTVIRSLDGLRIHGFGLKGDTFAACSDILTSADSMAWSYNARMSPPLAGCTHKSCANCHVFALAWRRRLTSRLNQLRLWEETCDA
jgi:hypothetical protein